MGILDRLANRAVDRAVDKAVDKTVTKTVDTVVDKTIGKAVEKTVNEKAEKMVVKETDTLVEALLHCSKCGAVISKDDKVCPSCGAEIEAEKIQAVEELQKNKEETLDKLNEQKEEDKEQVTTEKIENENKTENKQGESDSKFVKWLKKKNDTKDTTDEFEKEDIEQGKVVSIFAYFFWLVLIPLFGAKQSKFARYHANQGIVLAICETIWWVLEIVLSAILGGVPFLGAFISVVMGLANLIFLVFIVVGIMNALNGKAKELPIIGKFKILK